MQWIFSSFLLFLFSFFSPISFSDQDLISVFPLDHYDQVVADWIKPNDPNYDKPLLSGTMQQQHWQTFNKHYFGTLSPWNSDYINKILHQTAPDDLKTIENIQNDVW